MKEESIILTSFPRKWESRLIGWIPVFTGMTTAFTIIMDEELCFA